MRIVPLALATAAVFILAPQAVAADTEAQPPEVVARCQSCHGPGGDSASASVPRLNGQQAAYIANQLQDFLDPTRMDPHAIKSMWDVVSNTNSAAFPVIAAYYASQAPTRSRSGALHAAEGKTLYDNGAPGVPACQACHGANGEGNGAVPRLAGQHGEYLFNQMTRLELDIRESGVMHPNLKSISDAQIKALVAYLAND